jgi:hypothetical protein
MPIFPTPTFPLTCNIWHTADNATPTIPPITPPDVANCPAQTAQPLGLILWTFAPNVSANPYGAIIIRLPKGTQVRDGLYNTAGSARGYGDVVEVPESSGCFYGVTFKMTVGRGYPNEHVRCFAVRLTKGSYLD